MSAAVAAAMALGLAVSLPSAKSTVIEASAALASDYDTASIVRDMGLGWNLGNSLESTPGDETSWGNPKVTQNIIRAVKAKGFNTIRLPVTWSQYLDSSNKINSAWMARVKEVVDWAVDEDMYVILNTHHEAWNEPTSENFSTAKNTLTTVWTQIAGEFKDYDYHLIFEGMNEPRDYESGYDNNGNPYDDWWGNDVMWNNINLLNQAFVETVRATGGNNDVRALMLPTYAASTSGYQLMDAWKNLSGDSHVIVSLHAYTPYNFALGGYTGVQFSDNFKNDLNNLFSWIDSIFLAKGYSVVIGEFSASDWSNQSERIKWAEYYANNVKTLSSKYSNASVSAVLWDNNSVGTNDSEHHYYLNRDNFTWYEQNLPIVNKLISILGETDNSASFVPVYDRDGYITLEGNEKYWVQKTISRSELFAGYDASDIISVTLKSDYAFTAFDSSWKQTPGVYEYTYPIDEIGNDGVTIGASLGEGVTSTLEWKVNLNLIRAKYKQFTALDDSGKYCERAVFEIKRSELDKLDSASITFTYKNYSKTVTTHKYFTKILADGNYASSQDGYVFVMCTLTGIPNKLISLSNGGLDINIKLNYL